MTLKVVGWELCQRTAYYYGYNTYYWETERGAEIDFIIQREGKLIPIEVKSADNTRAKSLKVIWISINPIMR